MAELATIARPYAEAVFDLANRTSSLARWSAVLSSMAVAAEAPQVRALLGDPRVPSSRLVDLITGLFSGDQPNELHGFISTVVENGRLLALPQVSALFETLKNEHEGVVDAQIESAFALEGSQLSDLIASLERRFGRKINPQVSVNQDLIGGVRITVGDEVIDGSVSAKLGNMAAALKN